MKENGIKHFLQHRALQVANYAIGGSVHPPLVGLAEEAITKDLSYLNEDEWLIYTSEILRDFSSMGEKVPQALQGLLK